MEGDFKMKEYYVSYMVVYSESVDANSFEEAAEFVANNCPYDIDGPAYVVEIESQEEREIFDY